MSCRIGLQCTAPVSEPSCLRHSMHTACLILHTLVECVLAPMRCRCVQADTLADGDAALLAAAHEALEHFVTAAVEHCSLVALKHSLLLLDRALVGLPGEWQCSVHDTAGVQHACPNYNGGTGQPEVVPCTLRPCVATFGCMGHCPWGCMLQRLPVELQPGLQASGLLFFRAPRRLGGAAGAAQAPAAGSAARGAASAGHSSLCAAGAGCVGTRAVSAGLQAMCFGLGFDVRPEQDLQRTRTAPAWQACCQTACRMLATAHSSPPATPMPQLCQFGTSVVKQGGRLCCCATCTCCCAPHPTRRWPLDAGYTWKDGSLQGVEAYVQRVVGEYERMAAEAERVGQSASGLGSCYEEAMFEIREKELHVVRSGN